MKRMICLILACLMLFGILAACGESDAEEMTAVTIGTEATEATASTEAATEATEKKNTSPAKSTEAPTEAETEAATEAYRPPVTEAPPSTEAPPATEAQTEPPADLRNLAMGCVGCDVSVLYAAIGYPNGSSYATSCMGDGEDGELYYNGFTVYTYRENGAETVMSVY